MREITGITIEAALKLDRMKGIKILAGEGGLNRHITKINIMEVPDILDWVEEGELLFTTLYSIKDDAKALQELIPALAQKNLAGLGVKPERYVKQIPEFMLKQADEFDFPLLKIPYNYSFSELINPILSEILNVQNLFLEKTLNIHETLTNIVSQGLEKLSVKLVEIIGNPIMILDANFQVLSAEMPDNLRDVLTINDLYGTIKKRKIKFGRDQTETSVYEKRKVTLGGQEIEQTILQIITSNSILGYLYTWEYDFELNRLDMATLKWASTIAALDIINKRAIYEVERRYKNELLYDLLKGKIKEREAIIQRGKLMDWDFNQGYAVIIIDLKKLINNYLNEQGLGSQNFHKMITDSARILKQRVIFGDLGSYVIILYPCWEKIKKEYKEEIGQYLNKVLQVFNQEDRKLIDIGIGAYMEDIKNISQSYTQAKRAINVASRSKGDQRIYFFDELGVYQLLYKINDSQKELFLKNTIEPLVNYDHQHHTELIRTLESYFEENGNLANIAKNLYIHYNTAFYRMQRIEEITGLKLQNSDDRLNLEIALKMLRLNDTEENSYEEN